MGLPPLVEDVQFVCEGESGIQQLSDCPYNVMGIHIATPVVFEVDEKDATMITLCALPLSMQAAEIIGVEGYNRTAVLGSIGKVIGVVNALGACGTWCDNRMTGLSQQGDQEVIIGAVIEIEGWLCAQSLNSPASRRRRPSSSTSDSINSLFLS